MDEIESLPRFQQLEKNVAALVEVLFDIIQNRHATGRDVAQPTKHIKIVQRHHDILAKALSDWPDRVAKDGLRHISESLLGLGKNLDTRAYEADPSFAKLDLIVTMIVQTCVDIWRDSHPDNS
jgi:hypothetical protein